MRHTELSARRFGLEIEFNIMNRLGHHTSLGEWRSWLRTVLGSNQLRATEYCHSDGFTWDLKPDSSCGWELATPALRWSEWGTVTAVLTVLNAHHANTNSFCGLHVHHEIRDFTRPQMQRLLMLWGALEPLAFAVVHPTRKTNRYCMPFKDNHESWEAFSARMSILGNLDNHRQALCNRRTSMNMQNWWSRGTVEFRLHHGTTVEQEIRHWTLFTQCVVELARRRIRRTTITRLAKLPIARQYREVAVLIAQYWHHEVIYDMLFSLRDRIKQYNPSELEIQQNWYNTLVGGATACADFTG